MVMEYVIDNVEIVRLVDPGNKNNVVSETMTKAEKKQLSNEMKNMLNKINHNPDHIKTYFKINSDYPSTNYSRTGTGAAVLGTSSFG